MKYMLLMYAAEAKVPQTAESIPAAYPAWSAPSKELEAAGVLVSNRGLSPVGDATTLRIRDGRSLPTDGPFAETHGQLGGCYLLERKDLDEALAGAAKIPTAQYGSIEIRPQWSPK